MRSTVWLLLALGALIVVTRNTAIKKGVIKHYHHHVHHIKNWWKKTDSQLPKALRGYDSSCDVVETSKELQEAMAIECGRF